LGKLIFVARDLGNNCSDFFLQAEMLVLQEKAPHAAEIDGWKKVRQIEIKDIPAPFVQHCVRDDGPASLETMGKGLTLWRLIFDIVDTIIQQVSEPLLEQPTPRFRRHDLPGGPIALGNFEEGISLCNGHFIKDEGQHARHIAEDLGQIIERCRGSQRFDVGHVIRFSGLCACGNSYANPSRIRHIHSACLIAMEQCSVASLSYIEKVDNKSTRKHSVPYHSRNGFRKRHISLRV
jgi:hypothetical protein